ncbi:hypothetical protein IV79_GL000775 [Pediococcus claussenii]|nr:hypothetical protein IV79_GL000775 [Pediococcus claussenii]
MFAIVIDGYFLIIKDWLRGQPIQESQASTNVASAKSSSSKNYKNGVYTGSAISTPNGDVQVQAVVSNGKITKVNVLKYPNSNPHDQQINSQALPVYKAEVIKKQNAKIQLMSGASETYAGFTKSVQNAMNKAEV